MGGRWKQRPPGSNWGDFGPDDQLGRLNLITRQKVLEGAAEVREGLCFCLSLPLDLPGGSVLNPNRRPPLLNATQRPDGPVFLRDLMGEHHTTDVLCDDYAVLYLQYSTQWDSLAHVGSRFDADGDGEAEIVFYNGYRGDTHFHSDDATGCSAQRLGIENMAVHGVQGRGVMIDLHRHYGGERQVMGYEQMMRACEADGVEIERGDMVCIHTGFAELLVEMDGRPDGERLERSCAVLDGHDKRLLKWIDESGLAALIADNYAVEHRPYEFQGTGCGPLLPIHELCLFKLGVHLGELWRLTPLANWLREHGRSRFQLTAPPLRLPGAVGSPVTPIATV